MVTPLFSRQRCCGSVLSAYSGLYACATSCLTRLSHAYVGQQEGLAQRLGKPLGARQRGQETLQTVALRAAQRHRADLLVVEQSQHAAGERAGKRSPHRVVVHHRRLQRLQETRQPAVRHRQVVDLAAEHELVVEAAQRRFLRGTGNRILRSCRTGTRPCRECPSHSRPSVGRSGRRAPCGGSCTRESSSPPPSPPSSPPPTWFRSDR